MNTDLKINGKIQRWLNDSTFSPRSCASESYAALLNELGKTLRHPVATIEAAYAIFNLSTSKSQATYVEPVRQFDVSNYSSTFLRPVRELHKYIERAFTAEELFGFYVHGSLSTLDYVENYSDFDTVVIVRKQVFDNEEHLLDFRRRLRKTNAYLYLLDPLQHHEHYVISEYDMQCYFEPIFPLCLFRYSTELTQYGNTLNFNCVHSTSAAANQMIVDWFAYFRDLETIRQSKTNAYYLKLFIQCIAMMPARFLQVLTGEYSYKKFTFGKARPYFTAEEWEIVDKVTTARNQCPFESIYPYSLRKLIGVSIHYKFLSALHRKLDRCSPTQLLMTVGGDYVEATHRLIDRMEEILRSHNQIE